MNCVLRSRKSSRTFNQRSGMKKNIITQEGMIDSMLLNDTCRIIEDAREYAYRAVNTALTIRNWKLGERIARENLDEKGKAEYGKQVITSLATILTEKYGKGLDFSSLYKYIKFYQCFPDILGAVSPKSGKVDAASPKLLPWTLYRELIRVEDAESRKWYEQEAIREVWSSRTLHRNISSQYYYRLMQSPAKDKVEAEMHQLTAPLQDKLEYIKNPVVAEFLGLAQNTDFTESDLEKSIIGHLQKFVMEMGKGFAFVARQKHLRTDMGDFYIDLVFYNYILKCFFLIDLKTTQITHQDVGQMDIPTIGLLLCSETSEDMARYSVLNGNEQIFQAKYLTYLPSKEELIREIEQQKLIFELQKAEE